jgi:hypothetical protein
VAIGRALLGKHCATHEEMALHHHTPGAWQLKFIALINHKKTIENSDFNGIYVMVV